MDNHVVDIRSQGREAFEHAMAIFMGPQLGGHQIATHFTIVPAGEPLERQPGSRTTEVVDRQAPTFVLFWSDPVDWKLSPVNQLPHKVKLKKATGLLWGWLEERTRQEHAEWVDHDGSMGRGFRIWNEHWTHVGGSSYAICALRAIHAWYGK